MFILGMNDKEVEGQWVWDSDGSLVTWFNWVNYEENPNGGRRLNCAYMVRNTNSDNAGHTKKGWADMNCGHNSWYDSKNKHLVCEKARKKGKGQLYYLYSHVHKNKSLHLLMFII